MDLNRGDGANPRALTLFLYLSDLPEDEGGETEFPDALRMEKGAELPSNVYWAAPTVADPKAVEPARGGAGRGGLRVRPVRGSALLWMNVAADDVYCQNKRSR